MARDRREHVIKLLDAAQRACERRWWGGVNLELDSALG
jgi:hypothetical protein